MTQSKSTRQQNIERSRDYSCQASVSERKQADLAEDELRLEFDVLMDERPELSKEELADKLLEFAYTNNYDDDLFRDVLTVVDEIVDEEIYNES